MSLTFFHACFGQVVITNKGDPPFLAQDSCGIPRHYFIFQYNSSQLALSPEPQANNLVDLWKSMKGEVLVAGTESHAERVGNPARSLDYERAETIQKILEMAGIDGHAIWLRGDKDTQPEEPADDSPLNRRVNVIITNEHLHCLAKVQRSRLDWVISMCLTNGTVSPQVLEKCRQVLGAKSYNIGE